MSFKELTGLYIDKININEEANELYFLIDVSRSDFSFTPSLKTQLQDTENISQDKFRMTYVASGDCCNTVWFSDALNLEVILKTQVMGVEEKDWTPLEDPEHEVLESCFWTLRSLKGYADIEVRNSHNGYYGGNVSYRGLDNQFDCFDKINHHSDIAQSISIALESAYIKDNVSPRENNLKTKPKIKV